jgi:leucyl-tRNA---protein transferase
MSAPQKFPRFFVTTPSPCPYIPGKTERKVFTELSGPHASELNEALGRIGFRRSQNVAYRPSCMDCKACVAVRVKTADFEPNATQRKILRRNSDVSVRACRPWATSEQFDLLQLYLSQRHPTGGMAGMDDVDYADMVEQTTVHSHVGEYREPSKFGQPGRLIGACITDQQSDGLSMVYSYYDAEAEGRPGLGNYIIMDHILRARKAGLPYVYLGYWVEGAARMQYKTRYRPLEKLTPNGWVDFDTGREADLFA